jgi:hypothetical protein
LVCCVNCICHVLHTKRSNSTPQHEVTFYRGHRLHSVNIYLAINVSIYWYYFINSNVSSATSKSHTNITTSQKSILKLQFQLGQL